MTSAASRRTTLDQQERIDSAYSRTITLKQSKKSKETQPLKQERKDSSKYWTANLDQRKTTTTKTYPMENEYVDGDGKRRNGNPVHP